MVAVVPRVLDPAPLDAGDAVAGAAPHALGVAGVGVRVEGQARLEERVEEHAQGPGVRRAPVVRLPQYDLRGRVVVGPAARLELLVVRDEAREAQVGERYHGIGVLDPILFGVGELGGRYVNEDVY